MGSNSWWEQWKQDDQEEQEEGAMAGRHRMQEEAAGSHAHKRLPPSLLPPRQAAKTVCAEHAQVLLMLCGNRLASLEERKTVWRALCLQWHPDKCNNKDMATAMFQYLQGLKDWFLEEP